MYERTLMAGWGDMDFNSHMRNTAYLDKSADLRMMYFADRGPDVRIHAAEDRAGGHEGRGRILPRIPPARFGAGDDDVVGTVRGWKPHETAQRLLSGGCARGQGDVDGRLDLAQRKLVCPPEALLQALRDADRSEDFQMLPNSRR
nr:hypothetical protein [Massilia polaris]